MKQNAFRHLDMDSILARVNSFSVNLQDFDVLTPTLAKVLITYSGTSPMKEEVRASIAKLFGQQASPIANSFRTLERTGGSKTLAGFVRYQSDVKEYDETAADSQTRYKQMASNLLMDNEDKSMWQIKAGNTGKYLVRKGEEDLSELVYLAHSKKSGAPTLAQIAKVPAEAREFAAFVDLVQEEVMHGYVVAKAEDGETMTVVAFDNDGERAPQEINVDQLVEVANLEGEDEVQIGRKLTTAGAGDKAAMIDYYKKAYGYAPEYVKALIEMIDQHSFA